MSIYALSDLHLDTTNARSMSKFNDIWINHTEKIVKNWQIVKKDDLVLICGDTSWAMSINDAHNDLSLIDSLNGKKIITYGNHDYWWTSTDNLNKKYKTIFFQKNNYYIYDKYLICGTKGSTCPNDMLFLDTDNKLYKREIARLENAIKKANVVAKKNDLEIILAMHYPPTNDRLEPSDYTNIIKKYNIKNVVFGHLHNNYDKCLNSMIDGTRYFLTSCDYLNFVPKLIKNTTNSK